MGVPGLPRFVYVYSPVSCLFLQNSQRSSIRAIILLISQVALNAERLKVYTVGLKRLSGRPNGHPESYSRVDFGIQTAGIMIPVFGNRQKNAICPLKGPVNQKRVDCQDMESQKANRDISSSNGHPPPGCPNWRDPPMRLIEAVLFFALLFALRPSRWVSVSFFFF